MPTKIRKSGDGYKVIVGPDIKRTINSEYAAWYDEVLLDEGEYEFEHFTDRGYWQWVASIPSTVVSSYWCSHYGGVPVGGNERCINGNVGQRMTYHFQVDDYLIRETK
jgi:hypothetical protein